MYESVCFSRVIQRLANWSLATVSLYRVVLWCVLALWAHPIFAAAPIHVDVGRDRYPVGHATEYLEDAAGEMTLTDVTAPALTPRWQSSDKESINFGFSNSVYWFRFSLSGPADSEWLLEIESPRLDHIEYFALAERRATLHVKTGDHYPYQSRPIPHRNFVLPLRLGADGTATVYLRVKTTVNLTLPMTLWRERAFHLADSHVLMAEAGYYGIVAAMLAYNFFIFLIIRDRSYLYYVGSMASISLLISLLSGMFYQFSWTDVIPPWWNDRAPAIMALAADSLISLFTMAFLDLKAKQRAWWRFFQATIAASVVVFVLVLTIDYAVSVRFVILVGLTADFGALAAGYHMWFRRQPSAGYFALAWTALLLGGIALSLRMLGVLPSGILFDRGLQIGSALDAVLLSFALAHRLRVLREENFKMRLFATEQLEQRVREKQQELEQNYTRLRELEHERLLSAERERIMRDMHDGVGGNLVSALTLMQQKRLTRKTVTQTLQDALEDLRMMIVSLNPSGEALIPSLAMLRERLQARVQQAGFALAWRIDDLPGTDDLGPEKVLHVMRLVQEAVTNALRHSRGTTISIRTGVEQHEGQPRCFVEIADNGQGFSQKTAPTQGLSNLRQRANRVGGTLEINSDQAGTRIRLWLPLILPAPSY